MKIAAVPNFKTIDEIPAHNHSILLRLDLNVPLKDGKILDDTRIKKSIPTILALLQKTQTLIILTHLGRPKGPTVDLSTKILLPVLESLLQKTITFIENPKDLNDLKKSIYLLENLRFFEGETKNDPNFAQILKGKSELYVNDAFSCSHRAHASVEAITHMLPSYGGLLLEQEIKALEHVMDQNYKPNMAVIGGSKISTKLDALKNLCPKVDYMVIGGAMANTFLKAQGYDVATSLIEEDALDVCYKLLQEFKNIVLPLDFKTAESLNSSGIQYCQLGEKPQGMILDFGPLSLNQIEDLLKKCKSVLWNGPLGAYEYPPFDEGSIALAHIIASLTHDHKIISIAGGGDTAAIIQSEKLDFTFLSTAGGAFLEWVEGKALPGIEALKKSKIQP